MVRLQLSKVQIPHFSRFWYLKNDFMDQENVSLLLLLQESGLGHLTENWCYLI